MTSPITIYDKAGVERLTGSQRPPGGGSQPVQAIYSADAPVTITDGNFAYMPFDNLDSGTELLDRSTPETPTVLADGVYAVTAQPTGNAAVSPGGYVTAGLQMGSVIGVGGANIFPNQGMPLAATVSLSAGDALTIAVSNYDGGAASQDVTFNSVVVVKLA